MAFKTLVSLDTDKVIGIDGKIDKKTRVKNPTSIEGYFLGSKKIDSPKDKRGFSYIHIFQTPEGNTGVWGKTDLDYKMKQVTAGTMVRASFDRMLATKNGDMYKFRVQVDEDNTVDVSGLSEGNQGVSADNASEVEDYEAEEVDDEDTYTPPVEVARAATQASNAKVKELLARRR